MAEVTVTDRQPKARRCGSFHYREALRPLQRRRLVTDIILADSSRVLCTAQEQVPEIAAAHSEGLYSRTDSSGFDDVHLALAEFEEDCIADETFNPDADHEITLDELDPVMQNLRNHKCAGSGLQPYELYKYSGKACACVIWRLLKRLLREKSRPIICT